jgi:hypothetical protein
VYAKLGDKPGQFVGLQSADGSKGFRLDYSPPDPSNPDKPSGGHWNWWDRSEGTKRGAGERKGAEYFPGTKEEFDRRLEKYQPFNPAKRQQPASSGLSLREQVGLITGLSGAALTAYLIVSEGSRLFPPRNLIPVP